MKIPQEYNDALDGGQKVMYAKDETGHFGTFSYGSKVEEFATKIAVNEYELLKAKCKEDIKNKISSPIKYFMFENRMDESTLASYVDMMKFRVKRHLKYKNFIKLSDKILLRYAKVFNIKLEDLKNFKYE